LLGTKEGLGRDEAGKSREELGEGSASVGGKARERWEKLGRGGKGYGKFGKG